MVKIFLSIISIGIIFSSFNVRICGSVWLKAVRNIHTVSKNAWKEKGVSAVNLLKKNHTFVLFANEEMEIQAFGSRDCTAEISCDELKLPPPVDGSCFQTKPHSEGHLVVEDSFGSQLIACDKTDFGLPKRSSRGGRDLYIKYLGKSPGTKCTIRCGDSSGKYEKLPETHSGVFQTKRCVCGEKGNQGSSSGMDDNNISDKSEDGSFIVGGITADEFEYPWMAALVNKGTSQVFCGASLINDKYILTAANCALKVSENGEVLLHAHLVDLSTNSYYKSEDVPAGEPGSLRQVIGLSLPNKTDGDEIRIRLKVASFMIHPLFQEHPPAFDVAILKLERRLNLVHKEFGRVGTVCLPKLGKDDLPKGTIMTVAGWGFPEKKAGAGHRLLQKANIEIYDEAECKRKLRRTWSATSLCAGHPESKVDTCQGDSGGPTIVPVGKNHYSQIGMVNWGRSCTKGGSPGVYTFTSVLGEWIRHSTQDAVWCSDPV